MQRNLIKVDQKCKLEAYWKKMQAELSIRDFVIHEFINGTDENDSFVIIAF